jgi:hypothetical protein
MTTLNRPAVTELDRHLAALKTRLGEEYGGTREVDRVVEEERRRFADARIHSFLPILIERSVRSRLAASD